MKVRWLAKRLSDVILVRIPQSQLNDSRLELVSGDISRPWRRVDASNRGCGRQQHEKPPTNVAARAYLQNIRPERTAESEMLARSRARRQR